MILTPEFRPWVVPFEVTGDRLEAGLSARLIYQDPMIEYRFTGSYDSVKRFFGPETWW